MDPGVLLGVSAGHAIGDLALVARIATHVTRGDGYTSFTVGLIGDI